jgi:hypothetical protein
MSKESAKIKAKIVAKLEKYPEGTTQEEIDSGLVKPEVIYSEDVTEMTEEQAREIGLIS